MLGSARACWCGNLAAAVFERMDESMNRTFLLNVFAVTGLIACVGPAVELESKATKVEIERAPQTPPGEDRRLKYMNCETGANGRIKTDNEISCENYFRNEAMRIGADTVFIGPERDGESDSFGHGCNNCVKLGAWAYSKKKASAPTSVSPLESEHPANDSTENAEDYPSQKPRTKFKLKNTSNEPFRMDQLQDSSASPVK